MADIVFDQTNYILGTRYRVLFHVLAFTHSEVSNVSTNEIIADSIREPLENIIFVIRKETIVFFRATRYIDQQGRRRTYIYLSQTIR